MANGCHGNGDIGSGDRLYAYSDSICADMTHGGNVQFPAVRIFPATQRAGLSLHAFMVQTLADSVHRTRLRDAFMQDFLTALSDMKTSQSGYELGNVQAYFSDLASHRKGLKAKPRDLAPTRMD